MWVDFTMTSSSEGGPMATMHFISEAEVKLDSETQTVELQYHEPSEEDSDIQVQMVIFPESVYIFRSGIYTMEQSFEPKVMTTGELSLSEGRLNLMTTTTKLEKKIDYQKCSGELDLAYTMFIEDEYSGDFQFQLKFYNDDREMQDDCYSKI